MTPTPAPRRRAKARKAPANVGKAPIAPGDVEPGAGTDLALPHERDESVEGTAAPPNPVIEQAAHDLEAGLVDTDLRATAGLDAERRQALLRKPPRR